MKKTVVTLALSAALLIAASPASARQASNRDASAEGTAAAVTGLLPDATAATCEHPLVEQPFAFLGDTLDYVLAPDGSFEGAEPGWLLGDGAAPVAGNDPFPIHAAGADLNVLSMPSGSSAVSAPMCVDLDYPHARLAVRQLPRESGRFRGKLRVETLYPDAKNPRWRKVDVIRPGNGEWFVTDFIDLEPERGGSDPGGRQVSLRFTVPGDDGGFEIDDVYVDPRFRT